MSTSLPVGRGAPRREEREKDLKLWRGLLLHLLLLFFFLFLPSYVLLRVLAFLFLAQMYRTEPNRTEIDATRAEENRTKRNGTERRSSQIPAYTRARARACLRLRDCTCTRVCFFNEIYYRTPNASGARGEGAAVRVLPTLDSLSLSLSLHPSVPLCSNRRRQRRRRRRPRRQPCSRPVAQAACRCR